MKRNFLNKPVIIGVKCNLRPFVQKDCETMFRILNEPNIKKLTGSTAGDEDTFAPVLPENESYKKEKDEIYHWYLTRNEQNNRLDLAIAHPQTDEAIGEVVFNEYDENTGNVNFRILLSEHFCNKGVGSEAVSLFVQYGFRELGLHKINLEVYRFNPRAQRVYEKAGFLLEGVKKEEFKYNNEFIDILLYGMVNKSKV